MQLIMFYWEARHNKQLQHQSVRFLADALCKAIKFLSELAVGLNVEIYCAASRKWTKATIVGLDKAKRQIHAQYTDGSGTNTAVS